MKTDWVSEIIGAIAFVGLCLSIGGMWIVLTLIAVGFFRRHTGHNPGFDFLGFWPIEAGAALYDFVKDFNDHDDQ